MFLNLKVCIQSFYFFIACTEVVQNNSDGQIGQCLPQNMEDFFFDGLIRTFLCSISNSKFRVSIRLSFSLSCTGFVVKRCVSQVDGTG